MTTVNAVHSASVESARWFLDMLSEGVPPELRLLLWTMQDKNSRFFTTTELQDAADYSIIQSVARDVYVGCGLRYRDLGAHHRGEHKEIGAAVGLWADLDIRKVGAKKNYFPSLHAVMGFIENMPFRPTVIVGTGGGVHAWWLFNEPWLFADDADRIRAAGLVEVWQRFLISRAASIGIAVDSTFDLPRVLRVPGTTNHKYGTPVTVLVSDGPRIDPNEVDRRLSNVMPLPSSSAQTSISTNTFVLRADAAPPSAKFAALCARNSRFEATWNRERPDLGDQSASAFDQSLANTAVRDGWNDQEIADLLVTSRRDHGDDLKLRADYYERTIRSARERVRAFVASSGTDDRSNKSHLSASDAGDHNDESKPDLVPIFPEEAWRGAFADYRAAMAGTTEAPDSFHFAAFWTCVAARLRRRFHVHYSEPLYPNPYLVTFGGTGDVRKTSGMRKIVPLLPDERIKVLRDVGSAEALADWMQQSKDGPRVSHLLLLEELSSLLTRGKWDGSTLISFLTLTFDTPPRYEVPFRKKPIDVVEPTPILLAGTTAEWFWKSIREVDIYGGFGNRLLFLTGEPKSPIPMPGKPDIQCLDRVACALDAMDMLPEGELRLDVGAQEVWNEFYIRWRAEHFEPLVGVMTRRIPPYVLKLALAYAALEGTPTITRDQIKASILVGRFCVASTECLVAQRRSSSAQACCEEAVVHALSTADLPSWKIHQRIGGRRFTADDLNRAVRALTATGAIIEVGRTARGGPVYGLRGRRREA